MERPQIHCQTIPLATRGRPRSEPPNERHTHHSRLGKVLLFVFIVTWAIEILIVQECTTGANNTMWAPHVLKYAARRLVLNLAVCTMLACLLNRFWLYTVFFGQVIFSTLLITYADYYQRPLSWPIIANQWVEGLQVSGHGMAIISWSAVSLLVLSLGLKVILREAMQGCRLPLLELKTLAVGSGTGFVVGAVVLAGFYKPIGSAHIGSPEYTYGYLVAWAAEGLTFDEEAVLADAVEKAAAKSRVLTDCEPPLHVGDHMVVIQVESLDFDAVDARFDGRYAMPFLHRLKQRSMFYMVEPFHSTGTSDADFSLLASGAPNGVITPFKVRGFPYDDALPWVARRLGYRTAAMHGNTGAFFQRRPAYEQMGFAELYFAKELKALGVDGRHDHEILQLSAEQINASDQPVFHFLVTWTSHGPFQQLPADTERLIPSPRGIQQHYLNNMHYVDRSLEQYYAQLPVGTTLIIYGDHHSDIGGYVAGRPNANRVPWIICRKGADLATRQTTRHTGLATSGQLNQLDLVCYVRDSLEAAAASTTRLCSLPADTANQYALLP